MEKQGIAAKRLNFIDIGKGIAIILVVFGHILPKDDGFIRPLIYCFHIPLFFMLSGMVFKVQGEMTYKKVIISKTCYLLIAYIFYSIIFLLYDIGINGNSEINQIVMNLYRVVTLYGMHVLWFVGTLIIVEIIFIFILSFGGTISKRLVCCTVILLLGIAILGMLEAHAYSRAIRIPMTTIVRSTVSLFFFAIGYEIKGNGLIFRLFDSVIAKKWTGVCSVILLIIVCLVGKNNGNIDIHDLYLGNNIFVFLMVAFIASCIMLIIFQILDKSNKVSAFLKFYGSNSLFVMVTHEFLGIDSLVKKYISMLVSDYFLCYFLSLIAVLIIEAILIILIGKNVDIYIRKVANEIRKKL